MSRYFLSAVFIVILIISCKREQTNNTKNNISNDRELLPEPDKNPPPSAAEIQAAFIAKASGFRNWNDVSKIAFTLNVDRGEKHFERSWIWKPKERQITLITIKDTVTYNRATIDSTALAADKAFINDRFWLLAPFNLIWDEGTTFTKEEKIEAPISKEELTKLTVVYGSEGGYTPGDAYDFFYGTDFMIREWVFRKGNTAEPSLISTWEDYEDVDGIKISKMRKNEDSSFKLYFTNIKIEKD